MKTNEFIINFLSDYHVACINVSIMLHDNLPHDCDKTFSLYSIYFLFLLPL